MTEPVAASVAALVERAEHGDRSALARILTLIERGGEPARRVVTALRRADPDAEPGHDTWVLGITGAPGAGKSTLTNALITELRASGARVAVLAIDPSSPFTGGAILGDRVRLQDHEHDPDVYVRSMATRGHLGGLARATPQAVQALTSAGFDRIVIETVGVGQSEVDVAAAADTTVVVVNPGWGDSIQAGKSGLLEVGDVFVVNKADRPGTAATVRDLEGMLTLSAPRDWRPPVLTTVATEGTGVAALATALAAHRTHLEDDGGLAERRERRVRDELRGLVLEELAAAADGLCEGTTFDSVVARVAGGTLDPYTASRELLSRDR